MHFLKKVFVFSVPSFFMVSTWAIDQINVQPITTTPNPPVQNPIYLLYGDSYALVPSAGGQYVTRDVVHKTPNVPCCPLGTNPYVLATIAHIDSDTDDPLYGHGYAIAKAHLTAEISGVVGGSLPNTCNYFVTIHVGVAIDQNTAPMRLTANWQIYCLPSTAVAPLIS